ncbi:MAG: F-box protein [Gammaproteobacteria bacterium]|nr:F-box protein [Gammaproteobacteria bacterium]
MLNQLPAELLLAIFSHLLPEELGSLARTSRQFRNLLQDNIFWKTKFKQHFPDDIDFLNNLNKTSYSSTSLTYWHKTFCNYYRAEYPRHISAENKICFSLVKEGKNTVIIEGLRTGRFTPVQLFIMRDQANISPLGWTLKKATKPF